MTTAHIEKNWHALYTAPRAEKKVSERLTALGIEHYLPLQKVKHHWSDRMKELTVPIINGYIFVKIEKADEVKVKGVYGVMAFINKAGIPVSIPENQISRMREMVNSAQEEIEFSSEKFEEGESITINKGPLKGLIGELVEANGKHKILVRLEGFGSALTTIPYSYITKL
jgi:transcriptional antiterminator NusG